MKAKISINTIFTDIGGVLLTNGWDRGCRRKAIDIFKLDPEETEERHHLCFDTLEVGKLSLDEYLDRVVFYKKQSFTRKKFKDFMYDQSKPFPETIELVKRLKKQYNLKVAVVSNEGRELAEYRIKQFRLHELADFFIVSSFVRFRKPDADIFRIALDTAQVNAKEVLYLEDRPMFVQVAQSLGIHGLRHTDYNSTCKKLEKFGLK
ncbi:HAD family phosphatase [Panacibacter ginsenosidivorans]|uniref:HAD family phosphatase n=1 Tax=Panacibacter ginsenosidivorans TaxID=1813871 RepID=A0A5B8V668_9BACT|nr:HAD family phosphatase [Panacibacter ginsenosidivorans]QEC66904.1 HAD family phosphatase [Panacibacter ginsenosidivorans]